MIDVSQWRASIGLWNYCQAASSRPANGHPVAHQSKSDSTKRKQRSSLVLSFMVLLLFISILCSGYLKFDYKPHLKGVVTHCYWSKVQCTSTDNSYLLQSMAPGSDVSSNYDVFYSLVYLMYRLLLSGDVELNPGPLTGNPKDILRTHSVKLVDSISIDIPRTAYALYAEGLIPQQTKQEMLVPAVDNYTKAANLMDVIEKQLKSSLSPEQYLIDICHVLINQQHRTLTDIATSILHQLGQSILADNVTSISSIPDDVQGYADNMRQHYKHQPIVATDWPPRIGKDFFGRLALVEKQDSSTQAESAWHMLRGQVDKTVKLTESKEISFEDVLQPTDSSLSLKVVIDGPPGIGKTTLCRKLLNMWSNGPLVHQQYDLVLYCPLRNSKIATATTLADLFVRQRYEDIKMYLNGLRRGMEKDY
uniref:NACHT domain-containing protein n=1 Tax=Amphimedon queenslandica TaxID=400682 RepID=A0A1X7UV78_AMPQE